MGVVTVQYSPKLAEYVGACGKAGFAEEEGVGLQDVLGQLVAVEDEPLFEDVPRTHPMWIPLGREREDRIFSLLIIERVQST